MPDNDRKEGGKGIESYYDDYRDEYDDNDDAYDGFCDDDDARDDY